MDDQHTFCVERTRPIGLTLAPEFDDGDLTAEEKARVGHLRTRFKAASDGIVVGLPYEPRFEVGEYITIDEATERLARGAVSPRHVAIALASSVAVLLAARWLKE